MSNGLTDITVAAERYPALWLNPGPARLTYIISESIDTHMLKHIYRADDAEVAAAAGKDFADGPWGQQFAGITPPSVAKSPFALVHTLAKMSTQQ